MARSVWKASLAASLIASAGLALACSPGPRRPERGLGVRGLRAPVETATAPSPAAGANPRLAELPVVSHVLLAVKDHYADPSRIDPRRMVLAALDSVARVVDGLVVQAGTDSLQLRMGAETHEIDAKTDSIWLVRNRLQDALGFVGARTSVDPALIERAAASGVLSTLDRACLILEPDEARIAEMSLKPARNLAGVGLVAKLHEGRLQVVRVIRDGPAARLGLRRNDIITEIGGHSTASAELAQAMEWLRGPRLSEVEIAWTRDGGPVQRSKVTREPVFVDAVSSSALLADRIGFVRLSSFPGRAARDLLRAIRAQDAAAGAGLRGLVLDLRDNAGGILDSGAQVADLFLSRGSIVRVTGNQGKLHEERKAEVQDTDVAVPMVVLVDGASAAAAEIVASALQENGRALVVGQRTFGHASIQVLQNVGDMTMKLTIASFTTASGAAIDQVGVSPDLTLPLSVDAFDDENPASDSVVSFARELLARSPGPGRVELLRAAQDLAAKRRNPRTTPRGGRRAARAGTRTPPPWRAGPRRSRGDRPGADHR